MLTYVGQSNVTFQNMTIYGKYKKKIMTQIFLSYKATDDFQPIRELNEIYVHIW